MGKFAIGLLVGLALAVTTVQLDLLPQQDTQAPCDDRCGPQTTCTEGKCEVLVVDAVEPEAPEKKGKRKTGRRRGKQKATAADGSELKPFVPVNDRHIPKYSPKKTVTLDLDAGTERLSDRQVLVQMHKLQGKFNKCLETAAIYSDTDLPGGNIDFKFSVSPKGKVTSVTASAPAGLRVFGIIPCVRKVVYSHRFPSFDGPPSGVDYSFSVG